MPGEVVTITGQHCMNFGNVTSVTFNGTPSTAITLLSDSELTATVPASATTGLIRVTSPQGTGVSATEFVVDSDLPSIAVISPDSGNIGTLVTITGANFLNAGAATEVKFDGTPATVFSVIDDNTITAEAPDGATSGPISVTTPVGTAFSEAEFTVTIPVLPNITSVTTNRAVTPGSSPTMSVRGANFETGLTLTLVPDPTGIISINSVQVRSPQRLLVRLSVNGSATPGQSFDVVVTNPDGGSDTETNALTVQ